MKYHTVWKPGGRPRRALGSEKPSRRKLQAIKPKGSVVPGREVLDRGAKGV